MTSIGIVGVGNIGGALAHTLLRRQDLKISLYDTGHGATQGKAKDLNQAAAISYPSSASLTVASNLEDLISCDVIVITAGKARQPGMQRSELMAINRDIIGSIARDLRGTSAIVIVVTNPVDALAQHFYQTSHLPKQRVIGMAGVLDTGRLRRLLADHFALRPTDIQCSVIGLHNDRMIPLYSSVTIGGFPLNHDNMSPDQWSTIVEKTRKGGAEIVQLLGTGSAFYAPAEAIALMVTTIADDAQHILPCSVWLEGEYGITNTFCGAPVMLGRNGVERIIEYPLDTREKADLAESIRQHDNV